MNISVFYLRKQMSAHDFEKLKFAAGVQERFINPKLSLENNGREIKITANGCNTESYGRLTSFVKGFCIALDY